MLRNIYNTIQSQSWVSITALGWVWRKVYKSIAFRPNHNTSD